MYVPAERVLDRGEPWPAELHARFQLLMGGQEVGPEQTCNFAEARILIVCPAIVGGGPHPVHGPRLAPACRLVGPCGSVLTAPATGGGYLRDAL